MLCLSSFELYSRWVSLSYSELIENARAFAFAASKVMNS